MGCGTMAELVIEDFVAVGQDVIRVKYLREAAGRSRLSNAGGTAGIFRISVPVCRLTVYRDFCCCCAMQIITMKRTDVRI